MISAFEYINYLFNSKDRYDIHSPFIYDFVNTCLKVKLENQMIKARGELQKCYLNSHNKIVITDAGAGSKKLGNERIVSQIFKTSSTKGKYADLLYKLVQHYHPNSILELGTSVGYGTFHLAYNNVNSSIISVDACSNTQNIAKSALEKFHLQNIEYSNDTFSNFFSQYSGNLFDLVFVDGHHDGKALLKYMQDLDPFTHNNTLFLLDDIRWSEGMKAAWNELVQMEKYHVSIDLFRMGIVIKRPQQAKEHFTIRY